MIRYDKLVDPINLAVSDLFQIGPELENTKIEFQHRRDSSIVGDFVETCSIVLVIQSDCFYFHPQASSVMEKTEEGKEAKPCMGIF